MAALTGDAMPPRPECEFDFNLPNGIEMEDGALLAQDTTATTDNNDPMEDAQRTDQEVDELFVDDENNAQQPMNYDTFQPGFSDDEGGEEAFDRSWGGHQARRASPKKKKSPRRSEDGDGDDEGSPRTKRPRKSLFGGPNEEIEDMNVSKASRPNIRHRMSSLNLDQQEAQDERTFNLGFGLGSSERDSMSPVPSRAPSEDSIIIPPDDQVGLPSMLISVKRVLLTSSACIRTAPEH